jgi:hypothetical protein
MKTNLSLSSLNAVSPLDGRYAARCDGLRPLLSEAGFMAHRVEVEIAWLLGLSEAGLPELPVFSSGARAKLLSLVSNFSEADAERIKDIEKTTNHDVKAVEYWLKEKVAGDAELERAGELEDTVVIYTADNGWYLGDLGLYDKRFMYEPGLRVPLLARGPGITAGATPEQFVANIDLAPTILDLAELPVPESMQGRSMAPLLRGERPADWRSSVYYRYYHDPGHHNTRAHYGVRTATHKLIHYWKKNAWELYDLVQDPTEQHNLLFDEAEAKSPAVAAVFTELKAEIGRLQQQYGDDGRYADPQTWPAGGVDGPGNGSKDREPLGRRTATEAIAASGVLGCQSEDDVEPRGQVTDP